MRVIEQDTGKQWHLDMTPELKADLEAFRASFCEHPSLEIRQRRDGGGATHYYRQCVVCGNSVGSALKKSPELAVSPPWKENEYENYEIGRKAEYDRILQEHLKKQQRGEDGFRREYDLYLATPSWRAKRAKVVKRANGVCEGCLERSATQVHHRTYDHIFEELMFELVAICDECHARIHEDKPSIAAEVESEPEIEWRDGFPCDACRWQDQRGHRRWCGILDVYATDALADGGECGPTQKALEPLK